MLTGDNNDDVDDEEYYQYKSKLMSSLTPSSSSFTCPVDCKCKYLESNGLSNETIQNTNTITDANGDRVLSPHSSSSSNGYNPNLYMQQNIQQHQGSSTSSSNGVINSSNNASSSSSAAAAAAAAAANRRDHNIDYSSLFVQLSGTLPTLYRCVSCNKIVSNRWHHANIHRPQSHECPVCGQKFTRRDNMKAHCKIKHADIKDRFFSHYVHM